VAAMPTHFLESRLN